MAANPKGSAAKTSQETGINYSASLQQDFFVKNGEGLSFREAEWATDTVLVTTRYGPFGVWRSGVPRFWPFIFALCDRVRRQNNTLGTQQIVWRINIERQCRIKRNPWCGAQQGTCTPVTSQVLQGCKMTRSKHGRHHR